MFLFLASSCGKKKNTTEIEQPDRFLRNFSMEFKEGTFTVVLKGEAAEKNSASTQTTVTRPQFDIKGRNFIIEVKTDSRSTGELFLEPETQAVSRIVIQKGVNIIQRNPSTGQINFSAGCEKLTYTSAQDTIVMEGSPWINQGANQYRAEKIVYYLKENRLRFEGNVQIFFKRSD